MSEYFYVTNSFAAPMCSDTGEGYVTAPTPQHAIRKVVKTYRHPCGLYAACLWKSSDAYHKGKKPLVMWLSEEASASASGGDEPDNIEEHDKREMP